MNFKPKSEEQLKRESLLPKGDYDFQVLQSEDAVSKKSGATMIKISIGIFQGDAMTKRVFDYLLPAMEAKLRHFCDTCGLLSAYEAGTLCAADCKGRTGKVRIIIEEDETGKYDPKNVVKDYVCRAALPIGGPLPPPRMSGVHAEPPPAPPPEDDVPFSQRGATPYAQSERKCA